MSIKLKCWSLIAAFPLLLGSCQEKMEIAKSGVLVPKTADEDPNIPAIQVNGITLHAESFGPKTGPLVVMVHGGPGGDYRYLLPAKELADHGFQVVFYDQRGSGLSQRINQDDYPKQNNQILDLMYNDLKAVIEKFKSNNQKVIIFGHSWGAILATGFTGRYPQTVDGLILCEPGGLKWPDVKKYVKASRSLKLWSEALNDATYLDQFITGAKNDHAILDYKMSMFASSNPITGEGDFDKTSSWRDGAVISTVMFEEADRMNTDFSSGIDQFNKPILFFYSEKNKAYTDSWAQQITSVYKNKRIYKINEVGHDGIITNLQAWQKQTKIQVLSYLNEIKK